MKFRVVDKLDSVCTRRKLKVNSGKSKVIILERREVKWVDVNTPSRVSVPAVGRCEVVLGEKMEEVKEFKYLGTVLCKHVQLLTKIYKKMVSKQMFLMFPNVLYLPLINNMIHLPLHRVVIQHLSLSSYLHIPCIIQSHDAIQIMN